MKKIIFLILLFVTFITNTKANTCDTKEVKRLTELANRVKINYEYVKTALPDYQGLKLFDEKLVISVYNVTEDIYIIMTNNKNESKEVILLSDTTNGKYSFETTNLSDIIEYKLNIYARMESCKSRKLKTISFIKPKKNQNSLHEACKGNENIPVCAAFITSELKIDTLNLTEYIEKYKKGEITTTKPVILPNEQFNLLEYKNYFIIASILIGTSFIVYKYISHKRGKF